MDAQILWDPYGTSEPQHGITSIVMGNCGLALAPVDDGGEDALVKSFVRVEAIPRFALEKGVTWRWHSYGEYLDALEGKLGINAGGLVGHIAVRQNVMGEESVERTATAAEVQKMKGLVRDAMDAGGAWVLHQPQRAAHAGRRQARGQPPRGRQRALRACATCSESSTAASSRPFSAATSWSTSTNYYDLASRTQRPIIWQSVHHRWAEPTLWQEQLDAVSRIFRDGYRAYGLTQTVPPGAALQPAERPALRRVPQLEEHHVPAGGGAPAGVRRSRHAREAARRPGHRAHDQFPQALGHRAGGEGGQGREQALRGQERGRDGGHAQPGSGGRAPRPLVG